MAKVIEGSDAAAGTSTAYSLGIGETASGNISIRGDQDWFHVSLVAGQTYTFALVGTGVGTANLQDPFLYLRKSDGGVVASNDDDGPGTNSTVTYQATSTGTYYLNAAAYQDSGTGQYTLSTTTGSRAAYDDAWARVRCCDLNSLGACREAARP